MKVFLSADMEGSAGLVSIEEFTPGKPEYPYFQKQMTKEVAAACRGAVKAGAEEVMVKDSHYYARNVIPEMLPLEARITRQNPGDLFPMMSGLQFGYDGAMMTGYHSGAGTGGFPVAHTFDLTTECLTLNGELLSEFSYNAYMSGYLGVPVVFLSGDQAICDTAKALVPGITTVATQEGRGGATISIHPDLAVQRIEEGAYKAFSGDFRSCMVPMPKHFSLTIHYRDHARAYHNSFYPGMKQIDAKRIQFECDDYLEILRAIHFVL